MKGGVRIEEISIENWSINPEVLNDDIVILAMLIGEEKIV